jgi:DNA-binding NarL/FixJ family response regulator
MGGTDREVITVFLADDNLIVREGVRALLNREDGIEVVGVAADRDELLAGAHRCNTSEHVVGPSSPST